MVSIDPCDSFSCSSSRVRTRLSAEQRRRDQPEVAGLLAHARRPRPRARRRCSRRWRATSACRKTTFSSAKIDDEADVAREHRRRLGRRARPERQHRLEARSPPRQRQADRQAVEGDQEADQRVDQRVDRGDARRPERQQHVDGRQQHQAQLHVRQGLAPGGAAPLGGAHAGRDLVREQRRSGASPW